MAALLVTEEFIYRKFIFNKHKNGLTKLDGDGRKLEQLVILHYHISTSGQIVCSTTGGDSGLFLCIEQARYE
jgi:hypothetical protein